MSTLPLTGVRAQDDPILVKLLSKTALGFMERAQQIALGLDCDELFPAHILSALSEDRRWEFVFEEFSLRFPDSVMSTSVEESGYPTISEECLDFLKCAVGIANGYGTKKVDTRHLMLAFREKLLALIVAQDRDVK